MPQVLAWMRDWRRMLPIYFVLLGLILWVPNLFSSPDHLYPVRGDSIKYQAAAEGYALWLEELPQALPKMFRGEFGETEIERYGFDSGIIQHATSYVVALGTLYSLLGTEHQVGRWFTVVLTALAVGFLVAWTRRAFGVVPAILTGVLSLLWPAHHYFSNAIMTEMPMVCFAWLALWSLDRSRARGTRTGALLGGVTLAIFGLAKVSLRAVAAPVLLLDLIWILRSQSARVQFVAYRLLGIAAIVFLWGAFLQGTGLPPDADGDRARFMWTYRGTYVPDRGFESVGLGDAVTPEIRAAIHAADKLPNEDRQTVIYREALRGVVSADPGGWVGLVFAKAGWFWQYPARTLDVHTWLGSLPPPSRLQRLVIGLALLGLVGAGLRHPTRTLPAVIAVGLTVVHAATHMVSRYNVPVMPIALAYAGFGSVIVWQAIASLRAQFRRASGSGALASLRPGIWFLTAAAAGLLFSVFTRDVWVSMGLSAYSAHLLKTTTILCTTLLFGIACYQLYRRNNASRWASLLLALILPGVVGLAVSGDRMADRDRDRWAAEMTEAGDLVVQELHLPPDLVWTKVERAEIALDMLPSLRGETDVVVRVNGREVRSYAGRLENPEETFHTSELIHAVQDRYKRVRVALDNSREDYLDARHEGWGDEYFPQWYRIPVEVELLRSQSPVRIEIELTATREGGSIRLYGDHDSVPMTQGRRKTWIPAFIDNPYNLSTYMFTFFASDRERGDYRMVQPQVLSSQRVYAEYFRGGESLGADLSPEWGKQTGEFRMRLRMRRKGGYIERAIVGQNGPPQPVWVEQLKADEVPISNNQLRKLSTHREKYFSGWLVF